MCAVLSDEWGWDKDGVEILGSVPVSTGTSFIQFPLRHVTLRFLRKTTSTAVYVAAVARILFFFMSLTRCLLVAG